MLNAGDTARLLAKAVLVLCEGVEDGTIVRQDESLPTEMRMALSRLSRLCLESGLPDFGGSVHEAMRLFVRPFRDWGIPAFADPSFDFGAVALLDEALAIPTSDCRSMGEFGQVEDIEQDRCFIQLLETVKLYGGGADDAYSAIRGFVVANPVIALADLHRFILGGFTPSAQAIQSFYRPIARSAAWPDGAIRLCDCCGGLLHRHPDAFSYPNGHCSLRSCAASNRTPAARQVVMEPSLWREAVPAVMGYWVGPGLGEIYLHRHLRAAGLPYVLYPLRDAADVGLPDLSVGIDVKDYASPLALAERLNRARQLGLSVFARKIIAVPDAKVANNRDYLRQLAAHYARNDGTEFMTISQTLAVLTAGAP